MKQWILPTLFTLLPCLLFSQSPAAISGAITDKHSNEVLAGATIRIKGEQTTTTTDNNGKFSIANPSKKLTTLIVSYVGYVTAVLPISMDEQGSAVTQVSLTKDDRIGSEVVVSASKRPEKITDAPASIQVIGLKELEQFSGSNVGELVSKVQGIEYTRNGVTDITFNARGFNSAFNNKVFQLVDGRNSMAALSGSLPMMNRGTTIKDDIEQLEIILGPQSALYGPNAHNAVFNTITKDPRKYSGTTVAVSAGSRHQFSGRIRQATKINDKWAYKLSGEYAVGREFTFYDSVYAGGGVFGPLVAIPERNVDFDFRHIRGEAHAYYSLTPKSDIIVSAGTANNNWPQVTTSGRNQMRGVTHSFLQARFVSPRFFATVYNTWGSIGTSFFIANYTRDFWNRTHSIISSGPLYSNFGRLSPDSAELFAMRTMFKEKSQRLNAELQYNYDFKKMGLRMVTGLNFQQDRPNGYGINLIDSVERIKVNQSGAVLQLEKSLPFSFRFISAIRWDHHSNFGDFYAPKLGLVKAVGEGSLRLTWGRAYAMPSILNQYAGINRFLFGNGAGIEYIPNGSIYRDPQSVVTTTPLLPEEVSTWELGYKGTLGKKLFIDINYYDGLSKNFISPPRTVRGRVLRVNGVKVTHNPVFAGVVGPDDTLRNAMFNTFFNYGDVRAFGLDAGLTYTFNNFFSLSVKYSWFGSDITKDNPKNDGNKDNFVSPEERSMNAPKNRGVAILQFQNLLKEKLSVSISTRYVEEYDFYSGSQIGTRTGKGRRGQQPGQPPLLKNFDWGPLGGFTTFDMNAAYKVNPMLSLAMGVTNIFDTRQIEFVGSPSIGRLIIMEVKVHLPNHIKKTQKLE